MQQVTVVIPPFSSKRRALLHGPLLHDSDAMVRMTKDTSRRSLLVTCVPDLFWGWRRCCVA